MAKKKKFKKVKISTDEILARLARAEKSVEITSQSPPPSAPASSAEPVPTLSRKASQSTTFQSGPAPSGAAPALAREVLTILALTGLLLAALGLASYLNFKTSWTFKAADWLLGVFGVSL